MTRASQMSLRSSSRMISTPSHPDDTMVKPDANLVPRKGSRKKISTARLGDYVDTVPAAVLRARLPSKKKKIPRDEKVTIEPEKARRKMKNLAEKAINRHKDKVNTTTQIYPLEDDDLSDTHLSEGERKDEFSYIDTEGVRVVIPLPAHLSTSGQKASLYARARTDEERLWDEAQGAAEEQESRDPIVQQVVTQNLKTTGLDDVSTTSKRTQRDGVPTSRKLPNGNDTHSCNLSKLSEASSSQRARTPIKIAGNKKTVSKPAGDIIDNSQITRRSMSQVLQIYKGLVSQQGAETTRDRDDPDRNKDNRSQRTKKSGEGNLDSTIRVSSQRERHPHESPGKGNPDGAGGDDGDDSGDGGDGHHSTSSDGSEDDVTNPSIPESVEIKDQVRKDDPNRNTATMSIPHWILWTAGVKTSLHRYAIIKILGLNQLSTFTFIKEDGVVRVAKVLRKDYKIFLSEAEVTMIWTAIRIVQMALMNKKTVNHDTIRSLITIDEIVRAYNLNELSKSKASTMDDVKPPSIVILTSDTWVAWYQQLIGYFKVHPNCTKETSLYYVIREPLGDMDMLKLSSEERKVYDFDHNENSDVYIRDRTQVWSILHSQLNGQGAYGHIKPYESSCNATAAMEALRRAFEGASMRNARLSSAYDRIAALTYEGNANFPFARFIETLITNWQIIEKYDKGQYSERHKITEMIGKIKVKSTSVEMAIHNIKEEVDRSESIKCDDMWPRIQTAITGTETSKGRGRNISHVDSNEGGGRQNGKSPKGKDGRKVRFQDKKTENGVDYTDVNAKFTTSQWNALSPKTRSYIVKQRSILRKRQEKNGKKKGGKEGQGDHTKNGSDGFDIQKYIDKRLQKIAAMTQSDKRSDDKKKTRRVQDEYVDDDDTFYDEPRKNTKKNRRS